MGKTKKKAEEPVRADVVGAPMTPATEPEPQGPEDALGPGTTRGDYSGRLGDDGKPHYEGGVLQNPRVDDVGDTKGLKGGVETTD